MFFTNITCVECRAALTEFAKLAAMLNDMPKVGRVDCTHDFEACDLLVNHLESSNQTYPYIMMLTPSKGAYVYDGELKAEEIRENFVKNKKYEKFGKHGGKGYSTSKLIKDGSAYI